MSGSGEILPKGDVSPNLETAHGAIGELGRSGVGNQSAKIHRWGPESAFGLLIVLTQ